MKKLILITILIILSFPLCGYTLKGGVTYTVETARKEAFADVEYRLPKAIIDANRVDPNFRENKKAIKRGITDFEDRHITHFSDGTYGVIYKNNLFYEYYYYSNGKLSEVGKRIGLNYPTKSYKFNTLGVLETVVLYVKYKESYIFTSEGDFISHWLNDVCYDINGRVKLKKY